jgi:hypothetical protein
MGTPNGVLPNGSTTHTHNDAAPVLGGILLSRYVLELRQIRPPEPPPDELMFSPMMSVYSSQQDRLLSLGFRQDEIGEIFEHPVVFEGVIDNAEELARLGR